MLGGPVTSTSRSRGVTALTSACAPCGLPPTTAGLTLTDAATSRADGARAPGLGLDLGFASEALASAGLSFPGCLGNRLNAISGQQISRLQAGKSIMFRSPGPNKHGRG